MNRPEKKFSTPTPEVGKQLRYCERLDDELFLIRMSPVDLMQLGSKVYFPEAPESTEKTKGKTKSNKSKKYSG